MLMHDIQSRAAGLKEKFLAQPFFRRCFFAILFPAVAAFILLSFFTGGDAWHGREITGRFYVAHHEGAPEHEVSGTVFYFSLWLGRMIGCLWLIGMTAAIIEFLIKRNRR